MNPINFETLEPRLVLSSSLSGTTLNLAGTDAANRILVYKFSSSQLTVEENGVKKNYLISAVNKIVADMKGGNDYVAVSASLLKATSLVGGSGNDTIIGGAGKDTLAGGTGSDTLTDAAGGSVINGGGDNDTLRGGTGVDALIGEAGNDNLEGNAGNDYLDGGAGLDTVDYSARTIAVNAILVTELGENANGLALTTFGNGGGSGEADNYSNVETILGGSAADRLTIANQSNGVEFSNDGKFAVRLEGRGGNDTLTASGAIGLNRYAAPSASLLGGDGDDDLFYDDGNDAINLFGNAGNDEFFADGDDASTPKLDAGTGYDRLVYGTDLFTTIYTMGPGLEQIDLTVGGGASRLTGNELNNVIHVFVSEGSNIEIRAGAGNDTLTLTDNAPTAINTLFGDAGNDTINGSNYADSITGGMGRDLLNGNGGNDTFFAKDNEIDTLSGGPGADRAQRDNGTVKDSVLGIESFI